MSGGTSFDEIAGEYGRFRPGYPPQLLEPPTHLALGAHGPDALLVDVGSGTGISTQLLRRVAGCGPRIVGIEPSTKMRAEAKRIAAAPLNITYRAGRAEALPIASGKAALVLTAQSVQWFDRPAFLAEAARVLRPAGLLVVLQNDRDWRQGGAAAALEEFLERHSPGYSRHYRAFDVGAEIEAFGNFGDANAVESRWMRRLSPEDFVAAAMTSTKAQAAARAIGEAAARASLHDIADRASARSGDVAIPYVTRLWWAQTRAG